ncbi:unnamed protein product [Danaus chrysippus]|uniref:(African queen) hypothetical protein n=1 Tax=Danaus chrysippus TaxID=151541 RepID=A0A8J2W7S1_9NEOP|nr:unnamed protein product [Danaus chrysippus]
MFRINCLNGNDKVENDEKNNFLRDLDDDEWHITHLRKMEHDLQGCEGETFVEKAKRYRKSLKNDGALVELVSSNAIPFNPYDIETDKCKASVPRERNQVLVSKELNSTNITNTNDGEVKSATISTRAVVNDPEKLLRNKTQRRSEYQFSSDEYYDDVQDFNSAACPEDVEVITLELDQIRNYYVECEAIVEWRSLEEPHEHN